LLTLALLLPVASGSAHGNRPQAAGWVVRDLGVAPGRDSVAIGVSATGVVVGAYRSHCSVGFRWRAGAYTAIPPDRCGGDLWVTANPLSITAGGRVRGWETCGGCNGGGDTYWLWPPRPDPSNSSARASGISEYFWQEPTPAPGQRARTCWLTAAGKTVCRPFRELPAAGCAANWSSIAINDRSDVVAYGDECENLDTGDVLTPASYFLAGPGGWVTFGAVGSGTINALNAKGHVVGALRVPGGGTHAFLWNGTRIVDLGTLGGRNSVGLALNDAGDVVGTSAIRTGATHGFFWRRGRMTDLGPVTPLAVNRHGTVLATRSEGSRTHAFLWSAGRLTDLGYWRQPASYGYAAVLDRPPLAGLSLDEAGRVAGADEAGHAVLWERGRRTRLPELRGAKGSGVLGVRTETGMAGWSTTAGGVMRAVLWTRR
jgi:probable HAF family extracellular repeat protein